MNVYDYYITPEEYSIANKNGISPTTLELRVRSLAWSKQRAMTEPPQQKNKLNPEFVRLAESNGICYSTFRYRVNRLGWTQERAATQPLQDRKKQAKRASENSRKYPVKYIKLARKNGINYDTFRHRIKAGWNIKEAAS